jgi:hypothetical protein
VPLPDINFENIRPWDGSRHAGFEELCSQLARLEHAPAGAKFHRKGRGADAGVECYREHADGTEIGWQAKYIFSWDDSLATQLSDSIRTALVKHPNLIEYIVCLPFDLPDSRIGRSLSARAKWDGWRDKWIKQAKTTKRRFDITLWGKSELASRLGNDSSAYSGRILYWFDREAFTSAWFHDQFENTKAALGARYTPETNVELPIRRDFLAFARDPGLQKQIDRWFLQVNTEGRSAINAIRKAAGTGAAEPHSSALEKEVQELAASLAGDPIRPDRPYPLDAWKSGAERCLDAIREARYWVRGLVSSNPDSAAIDPKPWAEDSLYKFGEAMRDLQEAVISTRWRLANTKAVLLQGQAGIGKSHLLADVAEFQIHQGRPALLVLGSQFNDEEPWRQILNQLDRPTTEQIKHFLGGMDAAAQAAGVRALICIDALNERNGVAIWPHRLARFLKVVEAFPRIGIIVSCRSTYVPFVIPDSLTDDKLCRVTHEGFAADGGEAAKVYLDKRGIVRAGAPNLLPEFENPLFLKTCCDFLEKEGKSELPRGLRGVTSIFGFYIDAVTRALNLRMKLDPHFEFVPKAIAGFVQLLVKVGENYVTKPQALAVFESVRSSNGSFDQSLLSQLESEGLLSVEPIRQDDSSLVEMVRFTFERFSDHASATQLLHDNLEADDVNCSFQPGQPLHEFVFGPKDYKHAGVIEAIAIQLLEQTGVEILDVGGRRTSVVLQAFRESLLWREQSHFTDRTFELACELFSGSELHDLLISISTEPTNKYNARFLHNAFMKMTLPERDSHWSVDLARTGFEGATKTLISWALCNGLERIDEDRAYLTATMLVWFLTTSHRTIRDKATKALACILCQRLSLGARLANDFATVNDPYVSERLLAAHYGATLQGSDSGLSELASTVFNLVFASRRPPVDALLRDHAHGIIEYARWRGALPNSIDISLTQLPYSSPWPIERVTDELIESYTEAHENGTFHDAIVSSTVNDGDFAVYQMDHMVRKWSPVPVGTTALPTEQIICVSWLKQFLATASAAQERAFNEFCKAAEAAKRFYAYQKTPETERLASAEIALKKAITCNQWEDFRVQAKDFLCGQAIGISYQDQPANFNVAWSRRWVCMRAHELGWTFDLFGLFESEIGRDLDRNNHEVERIGKKYQWVALHELLARMADNLAYLGDSWERGDNVPSYRGARQIRLRDIDPSLLVTETRYGGWGQWDRTWWVPVNPALRAIEPLENLAWLEADSDIVNDVSLIDLRNPKTSRRWLALSGFSQWLGHGLHDGREELQRETWFRVRCIVVSRSDRAALVDGLRNKILTSPDTLPKINLLGDFYLGEYPWHPELGDVGQWSSLAESRRSTSVPVRATVASYTCERGGYDHSIDRTVSFEIPAPWLSKAMGLRLASGRRPIFVDTTGRDTFFDPSVLEPGPPAALVDRDAFVQMLAREGLSAIWVIAGEKSIFTHADGPSGPSRFLHTAIYQLNGDDFQPPDFYSERQRASEVKLKEKRGGKPRTSNTAGQTSVSAKLRLQRRSKKPKT